MGREPPFCPLLFRFLLCHQFFKERGHTFRVDPRSIGLLDGELIRFSLSISPIFEQCETCAHRCKLARNLAGQRWILPSNCQLHEHSETVLLADLPGTMFAHHMSDLVSDYSREFSLVLSGYDQSSVDIKPSTWKRKCVNLIFIHNLEGVLNPRSPGMSDQSLPEAVDIGRTLPGRDKY
tara:strand:+ start:759 stop:1295 length:537 start_codon:yes stop_codon:yes gene_type:complete